MSKVRDKFRHFSLRERFDFALCVYTSRTPIHGGDENVSERQDTIRDPAIAPSQVCGEQFVLLGTAGDLLYPLRFFPSGI